MPAIAVATTPVMLELVQLVPLLSITLLSVPGDSEPIADEELAISAAFAVSDVSPVPPFKTGSAEVLSATASVPDDVIGLPVTVKNEGTVIATEVTLPPPLVLKVPAT
jgi:hypothetical protein